MKKIKEIWELINYPVGKDEEFDRECEASFHIFLDRFINICYACLILFGAVSVYFFVTHELLR
tara:strand:- start:554 stop:742 length:189 start_codon:yes stop_codon:yes gene_type:complete